MFAMKKVFVLAGVLLILQQQLNAGEERDGSVGKLGNHFADLGSLKIHPVDLKNVGLFGFSSGAFVALQFAVSHPERIVGLAMEAGGPYKCSYLAARTSLSKNRLPNLMETDSAS